MSIAFPFALPPDCPVANQFPLDMGILKARVFLQNIQSEYMVKIHEQDALEIKIEDHMRLKFSMQLLFFDYFRYYFEHWRLGAVRYPGDDSEEDDSLSEDFFPQQLTTLRIFFYAQQRWPSLHDREVNLSDGNVLLAFDVARSLSELEFTEFATCPRAWLAFLEMYGRWFR